MGPGRGPGGTRGAGRGGALTSGSSPSLMLLAEVQPDGSASRHATSVCRRCPFSPPQLPLAMVPGQWAGSCAVNTRGGGMEVVCLRLRQHSRDGELLMGSCRRGAPSCSPIQHHEPPPHSNPLPQTPPRVCPATSPTPHPPAGPAPTTLYTRLSVQIRNADL